MDAFKQIRIDLPEIGKLRPLAQGEAKTARFTLGCETLDRDFADYEAYKSYIAPLGIPTIRLQSGWAKTEKHPGIYDFSWLDRIVDDAKWRGLNILLETDYGNPIYPDGGGFDLAGGFPASPAALTAWDNWVEAMAKHYRGRVRDWAMWNEPDLVKERTAAEIVDFNIRTARIVKKVIPDARIAGLSLAHSGDKFEEYIKLFAERSALDMFTWMIYHGYTYNPDEAYDRGNRLKNILARYTDQVKLRQGENGCPSEQTFKFALREVAWSELSQSKWDLRRYIGDIASDVETSVFTICDFNHLGREINRKGLLLADAEHHVIRPKQAYYAIQHLTSVFGDTLLPVREKATALFKRNCAVFTFAERSGRGNICAYWDRSDTPGDNVAPEPGQLIFADFPFREPALVEMISGTVYAIPADRIETHGAFVRFRDLPVIDSPLVVAEKELLRLI